MMASLGSGCRAEDGHLTLLIFLCASLSLPLSILAIIYLWKLAYFLSKWRAARNYLSVKRQGAEEENRGPEKPLTAEDVLHGSQGCFAAARRFCSGLLVATTKSGQTVIILEFVAGMLSLLVYFYQVTVAEEGETEWCGNWLVMFDWQVDFLCNLILFLIFLLRLIAAKERLRFLFQVRSLRCLRALHLLTVPEFLQHLKALTTRSALRIVQLTCLLFSTLLLASGLFHLVENSTLRREAVFLEDTANKTSNIPQSGKDLKGSHSFWTYVYFSIVTLSTVGYGDVTPDTRAGRFLCCVFVMSALALFASSIPEVFDLISNRQKYNGDFNCEAGTGHVIVTGHITISSMENILDDFNRKDRKRQDLKIVYVDHKQPDLQMDAFIKRNNVQVTFLLGTLLRMEDLQRAKVHLAFACMFVANKGSHLPEREDSTTVMTVTSCKSFSPATRCIVQILQVKTKTLLLNIPTFSLKRGDNICCSQEIELGLLAQNCLAPGCGTLLMNLSCSPANQAAFLNCSAFVPATTIEKDSSFDLKTGSFAQRQQEMIHHYKQGCYTEIHIDSLSPYFLHMPYPQVAAFCKTKLDLLLVGLFKPQRDNKQHGLQVCPAGMTVEEGWAGIFFAESQEHTQRARVYCPYCHGGIVDPANIVHCHCKNLFGEDRTKPEAGHRNPFLNLLSKTNTLELTKLRHATLIKQPPGFEKKILTHVQENFTPRYSPDQNNRFVLLRRSFRREERIQQSSEDLINVKVDITGNYYWTNARAFQAATLTRSAAAERPFRNHIVVLLMAEAENCGLLGLRELLLPMRCSRVPFEESRDIVILGNPAIVEREWNQLWNLPKLTIVKGHPLCRADLRAISIRHCQMTLVLSSYSHVLQISSDPVLQDKAAILAALNVKALPFEDIIPPKPAPNTLKVPGAAPLGLPDNLSPGTTPSTSSLNSTLNSTVPITVQLQHEMNGRLLMPTEFDTDPGKEEVLSEGGRIAVLPDLLREPFINAECITFGCLDNLLVQNLRYLKGRTIVSSMGTSRPSVASPLAIAVLQHLICGFQSPGLDNLLAEGAGIIKGQDYSPATVNPNNVRIRLMAFEDGPWMAILRDRYSQELTYGEFFETATECGFICLGVARAFYSVASHALRPPQEKNNDAAIIYQRSRKRCVIANPSNDFAILYDDMMYILSR